MSNDESLVIPETLLVQLAEGRVEEMPLEEYLKGVVPTEMGLQKPIEALKAQAIAARSFAVGTRRHASEGFDICITTHCQVFKPKNRYADSDRAVDETAGQVLSHATRVTGAPFFAHCDGQTRSAKEVWSKAVSFLVSVPCICGYDELYGHGVGMCQRGAAAMAREGATAQEILSHYYSGLQVIEAMPVPRTSFRRSVILGHVVDQHGHPQFGIPLVLTGVEGGMVRRTNELGQFWISGLPAGTWDLQIKDTPIHYRNLVTDGRNAIDLNFVVLDATMLTASTMPLAYPRHLAGTLGYDGVQVVINDPGGNQVTVISGSAQEYNPGGFVIPLTGTGRYVVHILDQTFDLDVGESGLWVQFGLRAE